MSTDRIDAKTLARMFLAGAKRLNEQKDVINELNVFPVPDGDTGTNMTMTIMSAAGEVEKTDRDDMAAVCKSISTGSLRGARGNSGVILSQLLRGFTKVAREQETLDAAVLAESFDKAVETAYKAVMKPKEGTILTVAKGASLRAQELISEGVTDLVPFMEEILAYAEDVLARTPEMLPVLKQAGVVDSGGQGLVEVLRGALEGFRNAEIDVSLDTAMPAEEQGVYASGRAAEIETADIKFVYCTEFIILLEKPFTKNQEKDFKAFLESVGDSIVMVADEDLCKIHVHSNDPGLVIQRALTYGELSNMKIDNMRMEHRERLFKINYEDGTAEELDTEVSGMDAELRALNEGGSQKMKPKSGAEAETRESRPHKETGFVAVCAGDGLKEIFESLGVDVVISGGQTMNPSTADFLDAVEQVNADTVFFLPNNKNIILAAEQAAKMVKQTDIRVIPSKTIPQGISAIVNFAEGASADDNEQTMREAVGAVKSGEVTYAIRDTELDGVQIHESDYMGIGDDGILAVGKDRESVVKDMIGKLADDESSLISVYYGNDIAKEEAQALQSALEEAYGDFDVEFQYGGQPVYYYIVSVE
ncbi:MAG: DAK2 domain-containing protein [Lachnospiraceae bacterium]|nr:DAK2 domain-containing protein [Lachnospiraceae bacterium]